jgi:trans-2,3-dihydro-3-hydroxyanthranilate isomerase
MDYEHYMIDAFTTEPGMGNAAAVLLDARGLTDGQMQKIATEFNLSETTFILPPDKEDDAGDADISVRFRWFAPTSEVDLCGHASVAGLHAMYVSGRLDQWRSDPAIHVRIETRSGNLNGFIEPMPSDTDGRMIWLTLPTPTLSPQEPNWSALAAALSITPDAFCQNLPAVRTRDGDLIAFVQDVATLNGIAPNFDRLATFLTEAGARGLSLATTSTLTPSVAVQSRFFAPNLGVNEDPVTGSVTGPLAVHLVQQGVVPIQDGTAGLACVQGIPGGRTGMVYALVQRDEQNEFAVRIGGRAIVTDKGVLHEA